MTHLETKYIIYTINLKAIKNLDSNNKDQPQGKTKLLKLIQLHSYENAKPFTSFYVTARKFMRNIQMMAVIQH